MSTRCRSSPPRSSGSTATSSASSTSSSGSSHRNQEGTTMRIRIHADGRVLEGTALQMVQQMQALAFGRDGMTLSEYIDWSVDQLARMTGTRLQIEGKSDD